MPYFIPALAVAGGFWGIKKILSQDDSADQKVAQVIKKIPQNLRKYIKVTYKDNNTFEFQLAPDTPPKIKEEIQETIPLTLKKDN
ncbi:hypothetical protein LWC08_03850 [Desulfobaculum bizertense]|uniref:hypothetical protein n=1 Tax=Desulfobaculum bizertense TaxID=376490 RepID=UPI001F26DB9F|nr:hypothetical protein [Desulfobaculum bizertense]UIJ38712.1 hypothetical protein LWC08_03850 [Desulfobaculum bizertense]